MTDLFHSFIYVPIYNLLVLLLDILPGADLGLAVIVATLAVKLILVPLSLSAVKTQRAMRVLEPELKELREKYKDDKEAQAKEMFALYKKHDVKPFASILMLLIQIPVVLGLYFVCMAVANNAIDPALLYSFIAHPGDVMVLFLGLFTVTSSSIALALFSGVTQFAYAWYAVPVPPKSTAPNPGMREEFARTMALQARYMFPILIAAFSYTSGVIALYLAASNLFMLGQEFVSRQLHKDPVLVSAKA